MRNLRLLSGTAAILLLGAGAVSAQDTMKKDEAPGRAPAAQQTAPAEKVAPAMKRGEHKASEQGKAAEKTGQAEPKASVSEKTDMKTGDKAGAKAEMKGTSDANGSAQSKSKDSTDGKAAASSAPSAAGGSAKLSVEQRTKITSIIRQHKVGSTHLNVAVRIGSRVPDSVHFYPLPSEVYVIYPEWRGYNYILVGGEIIVIDPRTHEIVAILES